MNIHASGDSSVFDFRGCWLASNGTERYADRVELFVWLDKLV